MTAQKQATDRAIAIIAMTIETAIEDIAERTGADPRKVLNDISHGVIQDIKAMRKRLERNHAKKDSLRDRVLQEVAG